VIFAAMAIAVASHYQDARAPSCLKFDRFEWFGDEVDASAGGVCEVAAGLFEVGPSGEPECGDEGVTDDRHGLGCGAGAQGGGVFVEGDVADLLRGLTRVAQAGSSRSRSSEAGRGML